MQETEKCWKTEDGELYFSFICNTWTFTNGSRRTFITSWRDTKKGPITEIVLEDNEDDNEKEFVIIEILEKKFNKELYLPRQVDETMKKVMEICKIISNIDTECTEYHRISSLLPCIQELIQRLSDEIKGIHVYYGNGLFFGMRKNRLGKIEKLNLIPSRCMEFLGSRLDSIAD